MVSNDPINFNHTEYAEEKFWAKKVLQFTCKKFKDYLIKMMSDNIYNTVFFAS